MIFTMKLVLCVGEKVQKRPNTQHALFYTSLRGFVCLVADLYYNAPGEGEPRCVKVGGW